jgi:hypothetical protein
MKLLLPIALTILALIGCGQTPNKPKKIDLPTYQDSAAYVNGKWILIADTRTKDWYFDPYSLTMDSGVVSFRSFWVPINSKVSTIFGFNKNATGPYLQEIDCTTNYQLSKTLTDERCDTYEPGVDGKPSFSPKGEDRCWHSIKPRTAMALIKHRVCGRSFPTNKNINYFLYQDGRTAASGKDALKFNNDAPQSLNSTASTLYEVVNNEYIVADEKNNIRKMKIEAYMLDKYGTFNSEYSYQANCINQTYSITKFENSKPVMLPIGDRTSLSAVAFNRICGDHGQYMHQVSAFTQ